VQAHLVLDDVVQSEELVQGKNSHMPNAKPEGQVSALKIQLQYVIETEQLSLGSSTLSNTSQSYCILLFVSYQNSDSTLNGIDLSKASTLKIFSTLILSVLGR